MNERSKVAEKKKMANERNERKVERNCENKRTKSVIEVAIHNPLPYK